MHVKSVFESVCSLLWLFVSIWLLMTLSVPFATAATQPRPQDDFYTYVNADWLEKTPIPEDLPGIDNFTQVTLNVNKQVWDTLETLRKATSPLAPYEKQLLDLYLSYNDIEQRDKLGIRPLTTELEMIDNCKDHSCIARAFAELEKLGVGGPLIIGVTNDAKNSSRYIATVVQYGLGQTQAVLVGDDDRSQKIRALYQEHISNMLTLAGFNDGKERALRVINLEQKLAQIQWTPAQNRDPQKTYNLFDTAKLQQTLPHFPVKDMLSVLGFEPELDMVVKQPSYLVAFNALFANTRIETWQDYLRMRLIAEHAALLSSAFQDEVNAYRRKMGIAGKDMPQWLRSVFFLEEKADMLVGRVYVEHHFSDDELAQIQKIIQAIKEEYRSAITDSTFFSEPTKVQALAKLEAMRFYIGYPKTWKDYSALTITPDDLIGNTRRIALFDHEEMVAKLNKPVDPDEWLQAPTMVNAYYQPSANKFMLMAAILQPPFFDASWSDAAQMGGIGFIIGHEIGHGFDDQGSQYDAEGNLRNWWTPEDRKKFNAVAKRAVTQANAYEILPGHYLNGELELGEILGDLNGLHIAHRANLRMVTAAGSANEHELKLQIEKANRDFFEQAAKVWRSHLREATLLKFLEIDGHPPGKYRVNGIFSHLDAFHDTYQISPGDGMYLPPSDRLKIW